MKLSKLNPKKINFNDVDKNYSRTRYINEIGRIISI